MKCLKCGKESKYEFCRECKELKRSCWAMMSQNKKKLIKLLNSDWLSIEWFDKFKLYTENILRYGRIYMEFKEKKRYRIMKWIVWWVILFSGLLAVRSWISIVIIRL